MALLSCRPLKALTALLALSVIAACASLSAPSADTVYVNGKVITADKAFTIAQAVAVKDGKFVGVGTSDEMRRYASPNTRVVDLKGRAVIPGLMDSHTHMLGAGAAETRAPLFRARTVAEAQAIIGDFIKSKNVPPGEWVQTSGWHPPSQLVERRYLTRQEIDAVAPNHPVFVQTVGHFAMANTKALELAGITRSTPDPVGGKIFRDANGDATGLLEETAIDLVEHKIPRPTFEQVIAQLVTAQRIYNRSGITSTIDAALSEEQMRAYFVVAERKQATVRTGLMWRPGAGTAEEFERALKAAQFKENQGDDWVRVAGIKIVSDGGMTLRSAYTRQAYAGRAGQPRHARRRRRGLQAKRVVGQPLRLARGHPRGGRCGGRPGARCVHGSRQRQVDQGQPLHHHPRQPDGARADRARQAARRSSRCAEHLHVGQGRGGGAQHGRALANRAVPSRWLVDTLGIEGTAAGTDNQVNILNPFVGLYVMVTRRDPTGKVYGADQALTRQEALRLYTNAGPYYTFDERKKGTIEVGKLADMVVLSADYMTVPDDQIKDIKPVLTIVNDKVVYAAAD